MILNSVSGIPGEDQGYCVDSTNIRTIQSVWEVYQKYKERLENDDCSLRRAIGIAGEFFEDSHKKVSRIEQFANLIIALEALYTHEKTELTFRICQSCALLVGYGTNATQEKFEFLQAMFKKRGALFHGMHARSSSSPEVFINTQDLITLISIVRTSILNFTTLFLQGENDLKKIRKNLERAVLDESFRREFLTKANYEAFLNSEGI